MLFISQKQNLFKPQISFCLLRTNKMPRKGEILPRAPIGRLIMKAGAQRVSAAAIEELSEIMTEKALEISERAIKMANHSGRKTIKAEDIKLAYKY